MIIRQSPEQEAIGEFLLESNAIEGVYDNDSLVQAFTAWDYLKDEKEVSLGTVLKTHKILMLNQKGLRPNEKGYFREVPVYIGGHEAMSHLKIREELEDWCSAMNRGNRAKLMTSEAFSKALHVQYEKIHPFVDGNGRTGRMFMNWYRLRNDMPVLVIHEGEEQQEYYQWFRNDDHAS